MQLRTNIIKNIKNITKRGLNKCTICVYMRDREREKDQPLDDLAGPRLLPEWVGPLAGEAYHQVVLALLLQDKLLPKSKI